MIKRYLTKIGIATAATLSSLVMASGVASAAPTVNTADIVNGAVTSAKIAQNTIGKLNIGSNAVGTGELLDNAVTSAKIAQNTIGKLDVGSNAVGTGELVDGAVTGAKIASNTNIELSASNNGSGSFQTLAGDFNPGTSYDGSYGAGVMGNVIGSNLTSTGDVAGVIGKYDVTGTNSSTEPSGGVVGEIGDTSTTADGAVVAVLGGDSGVTTANSAFKVMGQNSTAGSGFTYGLDLFNANTGAYRDNDLIITTDIRLQNGETISNDTDGTISFGAAGLVTTGAVDFSGASSVKIAKGTGLAAAGNCAAVADQGKVYYATTTSGAMTSGTAYVCVSDANGDGTQTDFAWEALN